ncbi:MAG: serine/threonine protein kinase, partial [Planctomycetaceae bacterium]
MRVFVESDAASASTPDPAGSASSRSSFAMRSSGLRSRITGSRTVARSCLPMQLWLRKQLWLWPILAGAVLCLGGWGIRSIVEARLNRSLAGNLQAILRADVRALQLWLRFQERAVAVAAADPAVRRSVLRLAELGEENAAVGTLLTAAEQDRLRTELAGVLRSGSFAGFVVTSRSGRILASDQDGLVGRTDVPIQADVLAQALSGAATVSRPGKSAATLQTDRGAVRSGVPTMFAVAPVVGGDGRVPAVLALRIRPEGEFTSILTVARFGDTGEAYAFDEHGVLLSQSRFEDQLKAVGLIPDDDETSSVLALRLRDPGVDMTRGERPRRRRSEQSLTRAVAAAIDGDAEFDVDGYRDYRGVPVVGAWTWLPQYGFGVVTQTDAAEARRPITIIRRAFWGLFVLLAAASLAIFVFTLFVAQSNRAARKAAVRARRLGQYQLEERLGSGGMGTVYKARHALLRRPTAVKLLDPDKTTGEAVARFEREVQLTSRLNHPNTVAIYDYGRTPEGVFFYAMEYLDGLNLERLVREDGPQPEGRVIRILTQICGSLAEAHAIGLIHRDVKPANIVLCRRGELPDVVKLLDFGLVKAVDGGREGAVTAAGATAGTPLYMAPEAIERPDSIDARADLYAVGAVGYFLLTGQPVFEGQSVIEIFMKQANEVPTSPSVRLGRPVSSDLEAVLLACLEKSPDARLPTARLLARRLEACRAAGDWTEGDAEAWWNRRPV